MKCAGAETEPDAEAEAERGLANAGRIGGRPPAAIESEPETAAGTGTERGIDTDAGTDTGWR